MKTNIILLLILCIMTQYLFAQQAMDIVKETNTYGIDGTHLLEKQEAEVAKFLIENPDYLEKLKLNKTSAWNFSVGDTKTWIAVNFSYMLNSNYNVPSTCRAVGKHCYIFVENSQWGSRVTQAEVDAVRIAFDEQTPANSTKGIYETNVEVFGEPPDYDNDPKIIILLLDIADGYNGSGAYIAGYFNSQNQIFDNSAEIFFIDTNPLDLRTEYGLNQGLATLVHEFQHMIQWNYRKTAANLTFINEGCSLVAEVINGYPIYDQSLYASETNYYLYNWRNSLNDAVLKDYSRAAKFTLYLYEQFGKEILKHIVQSTALGPNTYPDALSKLGASITFEEVLQNWFMANIVNDKSIKEEWGYSYTPIVKSNGKNQYNPNINVAGVLEMFAVEHVSFISGDQLQVEISSSPSLIIKALKEGPDKKEVIDITSGVTFSEPEFGSTYTSITFIIMHTTTSNSGDRSYSINAKGKFTASELRHDNSEAAGWFASGPLDTFCVVFDGIPGGKLDSIKIATKREGTLIASIYTYTGSNIPSPLGKRLSDYFTLYSTETLFAPYPVPYTNWVKQNLTDQNISIDLPFAVAIGIQQDTTTCAHVMVAAAPGAGFANSWTYISDMQRWFYRVSPDYTRTYQYMVHAYVSLGNTTDVVELTLSYFKLGQNYPNPFNPSTKIKFSLEKAGMTKLTIYDILGKELTTLINERKDAGTYEVIFNAANYASGVYYYKLQSDNMVQTKKMMLIK